MRDNNYYIYIIIVVIYYRYASTHMCMIVRGDEILYNSNGSAYGINLQSIEKHLKFCNNKLECISFSISLAAT